MSDKWQMPWALPLGSREDGCGGEAVQAEPEPERRVRGEGGREGGAGAPGGGVTWQEEAPLGTGGRRPGRGSGTGAQTPGRWSHASAHGRPGAARAGGQAQVNPSRPKPRGHDERAEPRQLCCARRAARGACSALRRRKGALTISPSERAAPAPQTEARRPRKGRGDRLTGRDHTDAPRAALALGSGLECKKRKLKQGSGGYRLPSRTHILKGPG